ncbi:MAG: hypothetical protein ACD_54C00087G0001 [uncultured bacterium]|nr:MAG: hypothetical protein ACD_54C00087G0001 [uncultured bacterium]
MRVFGRLGAHHFGRVQRQRIGDRHRLWRGQASQLPDPLTRGFGVMIPQRAINGIAGRASGQGSLQVCAADVCRQAFDLCRDLFQRIAIARVGHAFTPARDAIAADTHGQHMRMRLRAA